MVSLQSTEYLWCKRKKKTISKLYSASYFFLDLTIQHYSITKLQASLFVFFLFLFWRLYIFACLYKKMFPIMKINLINPFLWLNYFFTRKKKNSFFQIFLTSMSWLMCKMWMLVWNFYFWKKIMNAAMWQQQFKKKR